MEKLPIALQLYSLRDLSKDSLAKSLELAADLGYEGVEFAGYFDLASAELSDLLAELGLVPVSSHVSYERLVNHLAEEIEYNLAIENYTLVCPSPPQGFVAEAEAWIKLGKELEQIGKKLNDHGLRLGYHNHSQEFVKLDGTFGLDLLFEAADPQYLFAELDLGWALYSGLDPTVYLASLKGRCPLVHVKDFNRDQKQVDVGTGELDLEQVVQTADKIGVEWLIIETEEYSVSPSYSIESGLQRLKIARKTL